MGLIDEAFKRSPRNNSFGDAAAAMSNPGVTQVQTAAPAAPQSAAARMAALPGAAPATPTAPSASVGTSAREQMSTLPGNQPTAPKPMPAAAQPDPVAAHNQKLAAAQELQSWQQAPSTSASPADSQAARKNYLELQQKSVDMQPSYFTQEGPMTAKNRAAVESSASNALQSMYAPQTPAPASTTAPSEQVGAGAGRGVVNPSMAEPSKPLPQPGPANAPSGAEVMPGVYQHGRGQYSDSAAGMGMPAGFTGKPSAQNLAAADNMDRPRGLVAYAALNPPDNLPKNTVPLIQAATVAHSGNSWSAQNALRNAQVSASSIMNNGGSWDKHKGVSPERAYAAAMENADFAARGAQAGMDQAAMRENAATQREGMQQAGSTAREQMQEVGQNNRFGQTQGLARDKLAMEQETQGFSNRAAAQSEQLRNTLLDPKATPEQRSIAQRNLAALSGKTAADRMQTVALPDTTTDTGQVVRGGQALVRTLEDGTVVQVPVGAAQQGGAQPLPPGMKRQVGTSNGRPVYEDMNGKQVIAKG